MEETNVTDRLTFLAKTFDIFECDSNIESKDGKSKELMIEGYTVKVISSPKSVGVKGEDLTGVLGYYSTKESENGKIIKKVSICSEVFTSMVIADPTDNKMYLQWMLTLFSNLIKDGEIESAIRLVVEDLPLANTYLTLFNDNKRKKKFYDLCRGSYTLKNVEDPTNINQYTSLAQLFDAVDPFITKEPSAVERTLQKFVDIGQAIIPVKDRKFTVYIPKTTEASVIFDSFANWCTAKVGNGMFTNYIKNNKKPNGKESDIYIIINNKFFTGETNELYQIHFETGQLKDRKNGQNVSIFEKVLSESEGLTNYFKEELMGMAKEFNGGVDNNKYLDYLIQFGFAESLFELFADETPTIRFMKREIPKLPDISRFKNLDQLIITNAKLSVLHPSIGKLMKLQMLVLADNNLNSIPKEIGELKNLNFINLKGNKIKSFPHELGQLDTSRGGNLLRLVVLQEEIGEENYRKLKELLPNAQF